MVEPLQIENPQSIVNRARFASKDFFTFIDDLISRIQLLFVTEFNDFVSSGTGVMLIDMVSWACETLSFYIDRQASESYLQTARLRRSVNRLVRQLGYKMAPATAASTDLEVTLTQIHAFDVVVPIGFQFQGPNDLIFEATEAVTFPAGEGPASTPRSIAVREGFTKIERFVSDGSKNQKFRLQPGEGRYVAEGSVSTRVAGALWTESTFISFDQTDQYEIDYNLTPPLLVFGDALAGNVPANTADIEITYVSTGGEAGLVLADTITDVVAPLVVAFTDIGLNITNPDPTSGGAPQESLESAKANAPLYFAARDVAVVQTDYVALAENYTDATAGSVAVAQAFVALSADDDLTLHELLNNIRAITEPLAATIQGHVTLAEADLASITAERDSAETANTEVGTKLADIATDSAAARVQVQTVKGDSVQLQAQVTAGQTFVNSLTTGGSTTLLVADRDTIVGFFTAIGSEGSSISGAADAAEGDLDSLDTNTVDAQTQQVQVASDLTAMTPLITSLQGHLDDIETDIGTSFATAIETELQAIFDHVDSFLSSDCKSNLVQVPILTTDVDGFFQAPSTALIRALESYLRARKEVTQSVDVVSGEGWLVRADISGVIGVLENYVQATVLSNVSKALDDILKGRRFGNSLRVSDLYTSIQPDPLTGIGGVEGVDYAVFTITGPTAFINSSGNLVISEKYVITKGTVSLVAETAVD